MQILTKNTTYLFFPLLLILSLLVGCNGKKSTKSSLVEFDSVVVKQQVPLLQEGDSTLPYADVSISFTYPVKYRDSESLALLQPIFLGVFFDNSDYDSLLPQDAVNRYLEEYTERYQSLANYYYEDKARIEGDMPAWYWYYMNISNRILFQNESLLNFAVEYSDYEGGAHGSYRITYTNIDLERMVTLSEEDLFVPGYYKPLTEKIINQLMRDYAVSAPDSLLSKGFFALEDIAPNNNFWLDDEKIHYSYNQYEIAPYVMGVINVSIPYTELSDILLPEGVIAKSFSINK